MQYLLMIYANEADAQTAGESESSQLMAAYEKYTQALVQSGAMVGGARLQSSAAATSVRVRDGKTEVLDGPYADTKEQLGGYYLIEAPDLDTALSWAKKCPGASTGTVEVRPLWVQ